MRSARFLYWSVKRRLFIFAEEASCLIGCSLKHHNLYMVHAEDQAIQTKQLQPYDDQQTHFENVWDFRMFYESPTTYLYSYNQNIPMLS